jgi:hypothetical protein
MRYITAFLLLVCAALPAAAQPRHYAVLSLVGDRLHVAQYYPTESAFRSDGNLQAFVQLDDNSLDKTVLQAANAALKAADKSASPILLVAQDTSLYDAHAAILKSGRSSTMLLERIDPMLRGSGATHLVLVTKLRHEARVQQLKDTALGSGELEGLGFYVDAGRGAPNELGSAAHAVLGPFAYVKLELIDLAARKVIKEEKVVASRVIPTPGTSNPWNALTSAQKVGALQDILRRETARAIPVLLGAPRL